MRRGRHLHGLRRQQLHQRGHVLRLSFWLYVKLRRNRVHLHGKYDLAADGRRHHVRHDWGRLVYSLYGGSRRLQLRHLRHREQCRHLLGVQLGLHPQLPDGALSVELPADGPDGAADGRVVPVIVAGQLHGLQQ